MSVKLNHFQSSQANSEDQEIEFPEHQETGKTQTFAEKHQRLKDSREILRRFIDNIGPDDHYALDMKKYEHIVDPRILHVKVNKDILMLADSSIKKMYVNKKIKKNWSKEDIIILAWLIDKYGKAPDDYDQNDWKQLASMIPGKDHEQSMFKWMSLRISRKTLQKREWTPAEEKFLKEIVERLGTKSWFEVSKQLYHNQGKSIKIYRSPKHCRERWACYLDPKVKKGPWKPEEDIILLKEYMTIGKKWSNIAKKLNGRTENAIKNRFTLLLDKKQATYKNNKNAISDEQYIAMIIENLEVGMMIVTEPNQVKQYMQEHNQQEVSSPSAKQQDFAEPLALLKIESYGQSKSWKEPESPKTPGHFKIITGDQVSSVDKPIKLEKMTIQKFFMMNKPSLKAAVLHMASNKIIIKQEVYEEPIIRHTREPSIYQDFAPFDQNVFDHQPNQINFQDEMHEERDHPSTEDDHW